MLNEQIDQLIKESMVAKTATRTRTLRAIKDQFLIHKTAKDAQPLDKVAELAILKKMVKQRNESATQYKLVGREDLYAIETTEAEILKEFIPEGASEEDVKCIVQEVILDEHWYNTGPAIPKREMGKAVKLVKAKLPNADGKLISDIIKLYIV